MKVSNNRIGFTTWMGGNVVLKSENFELEVEVHLYSVQENMYDHIDYDDSEVNIQNFKFRGDVANLGEVKARLEREGMRDLLAELNELVNKEDSEELKDAILQNNKAELKRMYKGTNVVTDKFFRDLIQEEKNVIILNHYIKNFETLKSRIGIRANFLVKLRVSLTEEQKVDPKSQKVVTLKWLKKQLKKLNK